MDPETLVVVGNGMVGYRFCRTLIERDGHRRYRVIVVGEEPRPAYDRVHLTDLFVGRTAEELVLAPPAWYEDHGLDLYLGDRIVAIDRERQIVRSAGGRGIPYDQLILATGSRPVVPPAEGTDLPGVFRYRTVEHLSAILDYARRVNRAAVIGGGLLGLEAARALQELGLDVSVVEARGPGLMARQLDREGGKALQAEVEKLGVKVYAGRQTKWIQASGDDLIVRFAYGGQLNVDMVVISVGVRPRDDLATGCGLPCGRYGGIVVDDHLQTQDPRIHAIGDCVSHRGKVYGFLAPGQRMADVVATNLTGGQASFEGWTPSVKLKLMGIEVAIAGEPANLRERQTVLVGRRNGMYRKLILDEGRLAGAVAVGPWREFAKVHDAISEGRRLNAWQVRRFQRTGQVWADDAAPVSEWPDSAKVCTCTGVTRGELGMAMASGATSVGALTSRTGAASVCGSCASLLSELVGATPTEPAAQQRGLLVASLFAAVMTTMIATASPLPTAETAAAVPSLTAFWRDHVSKHMSGFTLLALSLATLLLSLRKRFSLFSRGPVVMWRLVHGVVALGALAVLALHTELRPGANVNLALMVSFLGTALSGALAGVIVATVKPTRARSLAIRSFVVGTHIVLFWALPVLVVLHVAGVYYFSGR